MSGTLTVEQLINALVGYLESYPGFPLAENEVYILNEDSILASPLLFLEMDTDVLLLHTNNEWKAKGDLTSADILKQVNKLLEPLGDEELILRRVGAAFVVVRADVVLGIDFGPTKNNDIVVDTEVENQVSALNVLKNKGIFLQQLATKMLTIEESLRKYSLKDDDGSASGKERQERE